MICNVDILSYVPDYIYLYPGENLHLFFVFQSGICNKLTKRNQFAKDFKYLFLCSNLLKIE